MNLLGSGVVTERYTSEVAAVGNHAYTGTWGFREVGNLGIPGNVIKVWNVSGSTPLLADSVVIDDAFNVSDLQVSSDGTLLVASLAICQIGQRAVQPTFWTIPPLFLGGTAAAAGIALINSVGNLGGYLGPWAMGALRDLTHGYTGGLLLLAALLTAQAVLVWSLRLPAPAPALVVGARAARERDSLP